MMNTLFITGANRGIGFELVKQYLDDNWRVIASCRQPEIAENLKKLALEYNNHLSIVKLDVRNFDNIKQLSEILANESIDVLMSNTYREKA